MAHHKLTRRAQLYPHEEKLGVFLVEEYLGAHCGRVAHELSARGRLSFQHLVESLGKTKSTQELKPRGTLYKDVEQPEEQQPPLAPHEVGKSVAVLSHHGLITTVRAQPHNRSRTRSKHKVLEIDLRNILLRLRVPMYTLAVQHFFYPSSIAGLPFGTRPHDDMDAPQDKPTAMEHYWLRTLVRTVAMSGQITIKKLFHLTLQSKEQDHEEEEEEEGEEEGEEGEEEEDEEGSEVEDTVDAKAAEREQEDIQTMIKWCTLLCSHYIVVPVRGQEVVEERHVPKKSASGRNSHVMTEEQRRNPTCLPRKQISWEQKARDSSSSSSSSSGSAAGKRKRAAKSTGKTTFAVDPEDDEAYYTLNIPLLHRFLQDRKCMEYLTTKTPKIGSLLTDDAIKEEDAEKKARDMQNVFRAVFRAARDKEHHTQGTMESALLTVQDVIDAQQSPRANTLNSSSTSTASTSSSSSRNTTKDRHNKDETNDANDADDAGKIPYPTPSSLQEVVDILLLLTNMPSIQLIKWHDVQPPTTVPTNQSDQKLILTRRFRVHNRTLVRRVQLDTVEDYVFERFGEMSYRIFRMLMDKGHLDQKAISEEALVPLRTVRICLAKMTKDGLVHLQEVAKRNDRTPQNTWFFWGVRLEKTYTTIIEFIYRSTYNLVLRRARGVDFNEDMVRRYETSGGVNFLPPSELEPQVGFKACRDTDRVGVVVAVNAETETFDIKWPDTSDIETNIPFECKSSEELEGEEDEGEEEGAEQVMLAEETQLTEKDMNQYNALLLATDRIDHTIQALDEKLLILHEFHCSTIQLPSSLATQLNLVPIGDGVAIDLEDDDPEDEMSSADEQEEEMVASARSGSTNLKRRRR